MVGTQTTVVQVAILRTMQAVHVALLAACSSDPSQSLVAVRGCGLEGEAEFSAVRVTARGDFPRTDEQSLSLGPQESGILPSITAQTTGITVEGLVGGYVAAVGRSDGHRGPQMSVYFAPPDSLCSVPSTVSIGVPGAFAQSEDGRVLMVGGRSMNGTLVDSLNLVDLGAGVVRSLELRLPAPTDGQTLHRLSDARFLMLGGAHSGAPWHSGLLIDLDSEDPLAGQARNLVVDGHSVGLAYHAAVGLPSGELLVVGGCNKIDRDGRCEVSQSGSAAKSGGVRDQTFVVNPEVLHEGRAASRLNIGRRSAHAWRELDGVVWVAGGLGEQGDRLTTVERLSHADAEWEIVHEAQAPIVGATSLTGGLLVLLREDGQFEWFSEAGAGVFEAGLVAPNIDAFAESGFSLSRGRPLLRLLGERVVVDAWVFSPGSLAGEVSWIDLVEATPGVSPGQRQQSSMLELADGTVLLAGGISVDAEGSVARAQPFLNRLRPPLDGPDEDVPDVAGLAFDSFVTNTPGSASIQAGRLRLSDDDVRSQSGDSRPVVRAHVRGFRSGSFRFGFRLLTPFDAGARAHVTLEIGAQWLVSVELGPEATIVRRRRPGSDFKVLAGCYGDGVHAGEDFAVELSASALILTQGASELLRCERETLGMPVIGLDSRGRFRPPSGPAIGLGVVGGTVEFDRLRLSRR